MNDVNNSNLTRNYASHPPTFATPNNKALHKNTAQSCYIRLSANQKTILQLKSVWIAHETSNANPFIIR